GEVKKNRFEPSHNFFPCDYVRYKNCIKIDEEILDVYYHGDVIRMEAPKGWAALSYEGKPIGGVKSDGKQLKNHYPKHLRKNR
ncbi:MAG: hypothetical protein IJ875_01210, partial [Solobacterium sp.]|nr:hypothetical protein [Solobacterium sp.]